MIPPVPDCYRCGHPAEAHDHYRPGTECSTGICPCPRYKGRPWTAKVRDFLFGARLSWEIFRGLPR